jgi:hypothetical protein
MTGPNSFKKTSTLPTGFHLSHRPPYRAGGRGPVMWTQAPPAPGASWGQ